MEDRPYNKLTCPRDSSDDHSFIAHEDEQRVSLTMGRPGTFVNHQKVLTVTLCVLAVILLTVDIGLGVHYRNLTDKERMKMDITIKIAKLRQSVKSAIDAKLELKKELAKKASQQQLTKWELDIQKTRNAAYQKESDKLLTVITGLKSHIPLLKEGCRRCSAGWNFINSMCYYIPFSENIPRRTWEESWDYCKNFDANLIQIKSKNKQLAIHNLISTYHEPSVQYVASGFWIGARDVDEEGVWKWVDGTQLEEGFWNTGEPNNQGNEDCAAIYPDPRKNPFKTWNDADCSRYLRWICEKALN